MSICKQDPEPIFGLKIDENLECRRLHNEELHSLYCSHNGIIVFKFRNLRLVGRIGRMKEGRGVSKF